MRTIVARVAMLAAMMLPCLALAQATGKPEAKPESKAEAEKGQQIAQQVCAACHGLSEFRGTLFRQTWMARPVGDFYQHISTAMPADNPGGLTPTQYLSVVAYVLQLNGEPAGGQALPSDPAALGALGWPR